MNRRNITYDLTVAVAAIALVSVLPVHGWRLVVLCAVLLALRFRPRADAASRRERQLEKASDAFTRDLTDTLEIVHRGVAKMLGTEPTPLLFRKPNSDVRQTIHKDRG